MNAFDRTDQSVLGRWWWTVDRWTLAAIGGLIVYGIVLIGAAGPAVAEKINLASYHFIERHLIFLGPALALMVGLSLLSPRWVLRAALALFLLALAMLALTLVVGVEIKGAQRWLHLPGVSVQPSEFVKPAFVVVTAWLFMLKRAEPAFPGLAIGISLYGLVMLLLLAQPDLGMAVVVTGVWVSQLFIAGLPIIVFGILVALGMAGLVAAYFMFPHVSSRFDRFIDPSAGDNYQVEQALKAFREGGLLGTGPGQGAVKLHLPDAHADFIFAVAGEELGLICSILLLGLFAFIVLRGLWLVSRETSLFCMLAASGLTVQFGLQAMVNMGSSLNLMPTKGMTLPFVSYGGSSLLALGVSMGMLLALTRKRYAPGDLP